MLRMLRSIAVIEQGVRFDDGDQAKVQQYSMDGDVVVFDFGPRWALLREAGAAAASCVHSSQGFVHDVTHLRVAVHSGQQRYSCPKG